MNLDALMSPYVQQVLDVEETTETAGDRYADTVPAPRHRAAMEPVESTSTAVAILPRHRALTVVSC